MLKLLDFINYVNKYTIIHVLFPHFRALPMKWCCVVDINILNGDIMSSQSIIVDIKTSIIRCNENDLRNLLLRKTKDIPGLEPCFY